MYKLCKDSHGEISSIEVVGKNMWIPINPDNTDYQAFLLWKSEGNEPLPADE